MTHSQNFVGILTDDRAWQDRHALAHLHEFRGWSARKIAHHYDKPVEAIEALLKEYDLVEEDAGPATHGLARTLEAMDPDDLPTGGASP